MAIAAIFTNVPILMIYLLKALTYKVNRSANISAGFLTMIYIIGGGELSLHYVIAAVIEVAFLILIIEISWKWTNQEM